LEIATAMVAGHPSGFWNSAGGTVEAVAIRSEAGAPVDRGVLSVGAGVEGVA